MEKLVYLIDNIQFREQKLRDLILKGASITDFDKGYISLPKVNQFLDPTVYKLATDLIRYNFKDKQFDLVAGVPNSATALGACLMLTMGIPLAPGRKENIYPKSWRSPAVINGNTESFTTGEDVSGFVFNLNAEQIPNRKYKILLVEDFIASGTTLSLIAKRLLDEGHDVSIATMVAKLFQGGVDKIKMSTADNEKGRTGICAYYAVGIDRMDSNTNGSDGIILAKPHYKE